MSYENGMDLDISSLAYRRSSFSNNNRPDCVECAFFPPLSSEIGQVAIRDSKNQSVVMTVEKPAFAMFIATAGKLSMNTCE